MTYNVLDTSTSNLHQVQKFVVLRWWQKESCYLGVRSVFVENDLMWTCLPLQAVNVEICEFVGGQHNSIVWHRGPAAIACFCLQSWGPPINISLTYVQKHAHKHEHIKEWANDHTHHKYYSIMYFTLSSRSRKKGRFLGRTAYDIENDDKIETQLADVNRPLSGRFGNSLAEFDIHSRSLYNGVLSLTLLFSALWLLETH